MKYNDLNIKADKKPNRVGRGISAGQGKTAGRGTKGQKARAGFSLKPGFEGGQNPLMGRLPKLRGFRRHVEKPTTITTEKLNNFDGLIDNYALYEAKIISSPGSKVRVVLRGEVTKKLDVKLQGASKGAEEAIKKAGGSCQQVARPQATKKESDEK